MVYAERRCARRLADRRWARRLADRRREGHNLHKHGLPSRGVVPRAPSISGTGFLRRFSPERGHGLCRGMTCGIIISA